MAPSSCRNGKIVVFAGYKGREVPMRLNVTLGDVMGQRVWNAMAEPVPIPIGVSGGGFGPLRISVRTLPQNACCSTKFHLFRFECEGRKLLETNFADKRSNLSASSPKALVVLMQASCQ